MKIQNYMMGGVFVIPDGTELTGELLMDYINCHSQLVESKYKQLKNAYENDYEILHAPKKPDYKPDNRIPVNFARYIVDTMNGFFMGIPVKVFSDLEEVSQYVELLDQYNDQDDNNAELSKICDIYGHGYEMYYVDDQAEIGITYLSPMEGFMIYDNSIIERPAYFVRYYTDTAGILRGSLSDSSSVTYFSRQTGKVVLEDPNPHGFDGVPAAECLENAERQSVFWSALPMINAYNKAISEKANDVDYFADAYMKILGAKLDEPELQQLRSNRIINFDGEGASELVVDFLQKPNGDTTQENLINRLERLIFQISMVADISDENFGTTSGIALKYKLLAMSNLAKTKERKFASMMNRRYKLIFSNPVSGMKKEDWLSLRYKFTLNYPANELEEAQTAAQLSGVVSRQTQLKGLSIVDNVQEELDRMDEEQDTQGYQTDYPTSRTVTAEDDLLGTTSTAVE